LKHGANVNETDEKGNTPLHLATSAAVTETLLNVGANVNAANSNGETKLSLVCEMGKVDPSIVEMMLKFGADPNKSFPLHAACRNNDPDTVRLLLAHDADANTVGKSISKQMQRRYTVYGWRKVGSLTTIHLKLSPLCIACINGNEAIVDCLLINGASVTFAVSEGNYTPLHFAVDRLEQRASSEEEDPIVTVLLKHNAPVDVVSSEGETPLYMACEKGLVGVVKQLLEHNADVGLTTKKAKKYPLMIACERKFTDIAMLLLDRGADVNVSDYKQSPLKLAAANGDVVLVKRLVSHGANVNQEHFGTYSALHVAIERYLGLRNGPFDDISKGLVKSRPSAEANTHSRRPKGKKSSFTSTNDEDDISVVRILLKYGADSNKCPPFFSSTFVSPWNDDRDVLPPLSLAAVYGSTELAMLLIKYGARVNYSDKLHRTALHFVVGYDGTLPRMETTKSYASTAKVLLSAGADANATDNSNGSPLYLACERGKSELVKLLLSRGADPHIGKDQYGYIYPIHAACDGSHYDAVKLLLEYGACVDISDRSGKTALHHAIQSVLRHNTDSDRITVLVQLLLDEGASVNDVSENGDTPLNLACSMGLESIAKILLENGARVNCIDILQFQLAKRSPYYRNKLPLHVAIRNQHVPVVQLLLNNGANPNIFIMKIVQEVRLYRKKVIARGRCTSQPLVATVNLRSCC